VYVIDLSFHLVYTEYKTQVNKVGWPRPFLKLILQMKGLILKYSGRKFC